MIADALRKGSSGAHQLKMHCGSIKYANKAELPSFRVSAANVIGTRL